ncbi:ADP/ATP translocase 1-like [Cephus cinctus]|uniref:ADP/ATP translocase n=1 Tax=Cephus cinctus TaxID=211228 RepID=A0AAJ7BQI4_CEPCN|nr:ADP/ATP translocase 1-like [Cephus cinctus]
MGGEDSKSSSLSDVAASFLISGVLATTFKTLFAPIERVKLILQTQTSSRQMAQEHKKAYTGFVNAIVRLPKEQGFFSLWRGNLTNICRYFPTQSVNFSLYDVYYEGLIHFFRPKTKKGQDILSFLAGGSVGFTSCILLYPLTFCTTRIAVDVGDGRIIKREFNNLPHCLRKVYKTDGYKGFYQGVACSSVGMFIYRSAYFGIYTSAKRIYTNDPFDSNERILHAPFLVSLLFAQLASSISMILAYPLDTIARQAMLHTGQGLELYATLRMVGGKIMQRDGPVGFYRGMFTNLLTTISGSLILVTHDLAKEFYIKKK